MTSALLTERHQDEHQRAKYRSRRMFETDQASNILTAEERGGNLRAVGIARNMKMDGDPIEKIIRNTGLTFTEIEKL